jgi:phage terminase large subunit GpA-like protein
MHERFLTPTFDETNMLRRGSLSLWQPEGTQTHNSFAHHIAAEELVTEFKEGKGLATKWIKKNENNHWLDSTYMASAASEVLGVKLIAPTEAEVAPRHVDKDAPKVSTAQAQPKAYQHGTRFRKRPGGWINRR